MNIKIQQKTTTSNEEPKKLIDPKQKQLLKKYAVFVVMGVAFLGCIYIIFAPSGDKKNKDGAIAGMNTEIPLPKNSNLIEDKKSAYEEQDIKDKKAEKMRSLQDFSALLGKDEESREQSIEEDFSSGTTGKPMEKSSPVSRSSSIQNSANAYKDMNRTLGGFYERPDPEKEQMKRKLDELTERLDAAEQERKSTDNQMALMERSYQMASKYLPANSAAPMSETLPPAQTTPSNTTAKADNKKTKTAVVKLVNDKVVSGLVQEIPDSAFIAAYSQPRNYSFNTAVGNGIAMSRNTIKACIHDDQTVSDGQSVKLRLLESLEANDIVIPKNTIIYAMARMQGERMDLQITNIEYAGNIIPVDLSVFDKDGLKGIAVPGSMEINALKDAAANMGAGMGSSISVAQSAGAQVAMDLTRGLMSGGTQYLSQKIRMVKVTVKAGYQVLLLGKQ